MKHNTIGTVGSSIQDNYPTEDNQYVPKMDDHRKNFIMAEDLDEQAEQILPKTNNFSHKTGLPPHPSQANGGQDPLEHFTLNKYSSKPDLSKKGVGHSLEDSMLRKEMQTASFNKQVGSHGSKVINSEQPTENTDREVNLIDQRAFQMDSQGIQSRGASKGT